MLPADIFGSSDLTTLSLVFLLEIGSAPLSLYGDLPLLHQDLFQSKGQEILEGQVEADEQELCHRRH